MPTPPKPGGYVEQRLAEKARPSVEAIRAAATDALEASKNKNDAELRVLLYQIIAEAADLNATLLEASLPIDRRSKER